MATGGWEEGLVFGDIDINLYMTMFLSASSGNDFILYNRYIKPLWLVIHCKNERLSIATCNASRYVILNCN